MKKEKEIIIANYIIEDSSLLLKKSLKDIQIKNTGQVVELKLYYKPVSKNEYKYLRWKFCKETQHVLTKFENGMLCGKFLAKTKDKDLIMCKMHTFTPNAGEKKLLNNIVGQ